jgi:hypothetical protein
MSGTPERPATPASSWRDRDLRPIAIGAAAGLLVLLVGGVAFAAGQLGAPETADHLPKVERGAGAGDDGPGHLDRDPRPRIGERVREHIQDHRGGGAPMPLARAERGLKITAISGSDVTLETAAGWTKTVTITDQTTIERAGQKIALTDLKVGDAVRIHETRNADGTATITELDVILPRVLGTVSATAADSITLERGDGTTMTVHVTPTTTYTVRGITNATLADVKVGMVALAEGPQNPDGSLQALAVKAAARPQEGG